MFDLVRKLSDAFGVSGNEEEIRAVITEEIKDKVDDIYTDTLGNLIAVKKGTGRKIMLDAHMDEIGVMATFIDDNGFIRFSNLGWVYQYFALGQKVRFKNGTIGSVFYEEKLDDMKNLKLSRMYIDIGAKSREEAEKKVRIGDTACFVGDAVQTGDMIISKALDNRSGCAVLIKVIQNLPETDNELYFVFTVQEELGLRGARTAAYQIQPDIAIAIDVTDTGDTPECHPMAVKCGAGPTIKIKDSSLICHPEVKRLLEDAAKEIGIPYQYEVLESGGTDVGAIHTAVGGVPSGAVSIPCRYIHSPVETASLSDMENAVKLLVQAVK
ncbi:aminopeptidase [Clostridium thermosuccinogenes]|uniref:Aminopeptidase n=1 Tax=Clostridium thermosuccinogenes TaxID=84032 RepID=A0A2K2F8J5_9CLOT|nr:M42 family metallopeptidase [Pseudoclostridium thermosuccinogenes]AUS96261.1 aminopeptidase [Pseudoclostridium thermosuccinogenes]PNT95084.1 aminopeptidase [Pseudoclostridium thermosuccinogenes]PNT95831.1 aminopeptidase [Pseudoclostridium thermosuccinogenes]